MSIFIHNSLTRQKEEFKPLNPPVVNIYTCGVTVYDDCHIGHARSLYVFDLIKRYLRFRGFKVNFVRNITDIDDKIINRANELKTDWKELVSKYIERYYQDIESLGIKKADFEPCATDNIPEMIGYIEKLVAKGYAYTSPGGVYFNVRKFEQYGKLSGQGIDQMISGVRKAADETKNDPLDFALWKASKENEPFWESPWGKGRPGWHIECSVMSQKLLKTETLDIHAGGRDLIFPHHENEIAQSEALTGKPFVKYWIHHGLLTINNQKMSKSLGNFVTIKDFMEKYRDPDLLKVFFLTAHYSHPIDYNQEKIIEARQALERIVILTDKLNARLAGQAPAKRDCKEVEELKIKFLEAMDDDFNTPRALACVFDLVTMANKHIEDIEFAAHSKIVLRECLDVLGIALKARQEAGALSEEEIRASIDARLTARKNKDYALSDKIRKDLEIKGVMLEDTKDGRTTWRRRL